MSEDYLDIGDPITLDSNADRKGRISEKMKLYMNKVDIIPVHWSLTYPTETGKEDMASTRNKLVVLDYETAIKDYSLVCEQYGLTTTMKGLRLWNSAQSQSQDEFKNNFDNNMVQEAVNGLADTAKNLKTFIKSVGYTPKDAVDLGTELASSLLGSLSGLLGSSTVGAISSAASSPVGDILKNTVLMGKKMSLPKIWAGAEYSTQLTLNVRLVSPYGHPEAILERIVKPLLHLILLASPKSDDGMSYGDCTAVQVMAYGCSNIDIAYIQGLTVQRSGSDITFNKYQQPLAVDVSLALIPAIDGFASIVGGSDPKNKIATLKAEDILTEMDMDLKNHVTFGLNNPDNIIRSFQKMPGTSNPLEDLMEMVVDPIKGLISTGKGMIKGLVGEVKDGISSAISGVTKTASTSISKAFSKGIFG